MLREVRLNPAFAAEYPAIVPGRWYTAAAIAGMVKGTRIVREGSEAQFLERILPPGHFEFRGGDPRHGGWLGMRSRRLDRRNGSAARRSDALATR